MEDDDLNFDAQSVNVESDDEFDINSEEDNNSGSFNIGQDPNSSDDDVDAAVHVQAFRHLKGFAKSFYKKRNSRRGRPAKTVNATEKEKSAVVDSPSSTPYSRCNNTYFGDIVRDLDDHKKQIIRSRGFGMLLEYDGCTVLKRPAISSKINPQITSFTADITVHTS